MRNTVVYASLVTSFLWLLVGIALIALGWRVATVPGAGWLDDSFRLGWVWGSCWRAS